MKRLISREKRVLAVLDATSQRKRVASHMGQAVQGSSQQKKPADGRLRNQWQGAEIRRGSACP
ncbi:MAG: hypothetical protein ACO23P_05235, partial [Vulcanococcus sp.]